MINKLLENFAAVTLIGSLLLGGCLIVAYLTVQTIFWIVAAPMWQPIVAGFAVFFVIAVIITWSGK